MKILRVLLLAVLVTAAIPPPAARAASWDMLAGGVPGHDSIVQIELGFPNLPRLAYHYGITSRFSLGVAAAFDYAGGMSEPWRVFTPTMVLDLPMRIEAYRRGKVSLGIRLDPGFVLAFLPRGTAFGMHLGLGFNVGVFVVPRFMVGGGIDMPVAVYFVPAVDAGIPILFGPIMEFHASDLFAITFEVKLGPGIHPGGGVAFAMRAQLGMAFHF